MARRLRPLVSSRITAFAVLVAVPAFSSVAGATEPTPESPNTVESAPDPGADSGTIPGKNTGSAAGPPTLPTEPGTVPEPDDAAVATPPEPSPKADSEVPVPGSEPGAPTATTSETAPEAEPAVDPTLLDAAEPEPVAPVVTQPSTPGSASAGLSPEERAAALDAAYVARYRPAHNPVRLNITGRLQFANVSGKERVNGRVGGASIDIGPAWNTVAVAATLSGWGGRIQLPSDQGTEMNAMIGGGPTVGLGRLALMSHGYLDLRLGYDVFYGVVNRRGDAPSIVAAQDDDPQVMATLTENMLPHGPRLRLDMGLVGSTNRKFFHGFGISMGYQALVGSIRGDLPFTNMLTLGLSYWMG